MKYKGEEIGIPTMEQVEECCRIMNLSVPAVDVYNHYKEKGFLTKQKHPIKTLESMCSARNSVFVMNMRKNEAYSGSLF